MRRAETSELQESLARVHFACHTRQVVDHQTSKSLSAHQASILDHLDADAGITLSRLASHMGVTVSTMSLAIRRLVAEGYVDRSRDAGDGRRVCLRLTPAGIRIKEAKSPFDPQRVAALLEALTAEERGAALRGLALLSRAAQSMPRQAPEEPRTKRAGKVGSPQMEKPS